MLNVSTNVYGSISHYQDLRKTCVILREFVEVVVAATTSIECVGSNYLGLSRFAENHQGMAGEGWPV